ncbi:adenylate/guanylate cyclase domain-containing protein [Dyadobacter endophyticus]|uniref:Adenylate/guanylate cyclase domain-containing response regulator n=1 Tax=Dyadobacter endophyticus TaxID=1749036 RepID=A0ABQ1YK26_9BACT|nr:adenylate/guanylate cyclase domain-containing response regulator [Dyadobacter endophyticus]GGH27802.1 adenylate/guanylate cyclase domain-containing response regulator [Dyadobacter endophyticus]
MKAKILVVDDEADLQLLIKQKFRRHIREQQYEFVFAENGLKALEVLVEHPDVDMVLSDINMPEMDGLTLLVRLGEMSPLLKSVIVSAYGDMDNIRTAMNRGAFDFLTKPIDFRDLEVTMEKTLQYVAQLKETLKAVRENDILRMYVDASVLQFMTQETFEKSLMTSENIEGTVVFMDMCGFTAISEKEQPDRVVKLINKYFDVMVKEIIAQGGHVDKFMGDAVMAVFRGDYHLDRAVESSLAVRNHINGFKEELSDQSGYHPKVSIGINSGEMVSGNIGSAALKRLDYTVIGDVVNVAQRLQSIAKPGQVVVPDSAYEKLKEAFQCSLVGEVNLKNKSNPVLIYEVLE